MWRVHKANAKGFIKYIVDRLETVKLPPNSFDLILLAGRGRKNFCSVRKIPLIY